MIFRTENINLFSKTRYSLSEEDRAINGLLLILKYSCVSSAMGFMNFLGNPIDSSELIELREHVPYTPECIIDGEIRIDQKLLVFIEAKIWKDQFVDSEQVERYFKLLSKANEQSRSLVLLSPDNEEPAIVHSLGNNNKPQIIWRSWTDISNFLKIQLQEIKDNPVQEFLINEFLEYLTNLGVVTAIKSETEKTKVEPQLHFLLGNEAAEKILLHLYHHGRGHTKGIARDHKLGMGATHRVLNRFTEAGIILKESQGRNVYYTFNKKNPMLKPLLELIRIVYENMSTENKQTSFNPKYKPD